MLRPGGKRASLRFVDFSGLNLSRRNLSDADLSASVFDGARMAGARLDRANLFGSDLRKADLRGARRALGVSRCARRSANFSPGVDSTIAAGFGIEKRFGFRLGLFKFRFRGFFFF